MSDKLSVSTIDDEESVREEVRNALNGADSCFEVIPYASPEDFFSKPPGDNSLIVLDEYFPVEGYPSAGGKPRAGEVIEFCLSRLPDSGLVIYSNNPVGTYIARAEKVSGWADKTQRGSLESAVGNAIKRMQNLSEEMRKRCLDHLRRKEVQGEKVDLEVLPEVRMGRILYPFRETQPVESGWDSKRKTSFFRLQKHPDLVEGTGTFLADARRSFMERFHEKFKALECKSVNYNTADDAANRSAMEQIVDDDAYQSLRTITVPFLVGQIVDITSDGARQVVWHGLSTPSVHTISEVPSLGNIGKGGWIRAVVEKRMSTEAVVAIMDAAEIAAPEVGETARAKFWNLRGATAIR